MIEYLNANSGAFNVIFTAVVTLSTAIYALLTAVLVKETRKMRQAQTEPKIEVVVKSSDHWINLMRVHIKNIGLGPAYDVTFNVSSEVDDEGGRMLLKDFTSANFFNTGLRYIGPSHEIVGGYTQMVNNYDQKINSVLNFKVDYKDCTNKKYNEYFRIDFSEFKGGRQIGTPHLYSISESLTKIEKTLDHIATGWRQIKVDIFSQRDRDRERKKWEDEERKEQQIE